ncbi:MAG: hypothetical protein JNK12_12515 [Acidimicrobiales bacterium]|nr:hypothetical protein [Acidimicrobiales bacterium]
MALLIVCGSLAVPSATGALGTAGTLDPTFSDDGRVETDLKPGDHDLALGAAVQPDGKVVVVGRAGGQGGRAFVLRYTTVGELDPTFSGDGRAFINLSPGDDLATDVVVDSTGSIAVSLTASDFQQVGMARFLPDGTLDPSFSGDGRVVTDFRPGFEYAYALVEDNLNRYYLGGGVDGHGGQMAVFSYRDDGSVNDYFSDSGMRTANFGPGQDSGYAIGVNAEDGVYIAGPSRTSAGTDVIAIARMSRFYFNLGLDRAFSDDGKAVLDMTPGYEDVVDLELQGRKVVVAGEANRRIGLARFNIDGTVDTTFGDGGVRITDLQGNAEFAQAVEMQPGGPLVVAGRMSGSGGRMLVAHYDVNGTLDPTFGVGGIASANFTSAWDIATDVALAPDGAIFAAGSADSDSRVAVARFLAN